MASTKPMGALDRAHLEDSDTLTSVRRRADPSVEQAVRASIRDALYMMSAQELDGIRVNGVTCREQLRIDKIRDNAKKGSVRWGAGYYKTLRSRYCLANSVESRLQLKAFGALLP